MRDFYVTFPDISSLGSWLSQINLQGAKVIALYFTFALGLATAFCLLLFQEFKLSPINVQYPKVDLLSVWEPAHCSFEYPTTWVWLVSI